MVRYCCSFGGSGWLLIPFVLYILYVDGNPVTLCLRWSGLIANGQLNSTRWRGYYGKPRYA